MNALQRDKDKTNWKINFSAHEANIVEDNGNDSIVISTIINDFLIERILVDDGSMVEVLIFVAFKRMGSDESLLRPVGSIYSFAN